MITNINEKSKKSRYCWGIGLYVDYHKAPERSLYGFYTS